MEATAHFEQRFCCLLNLPSATEEQYLIQHMKHVPPVFLKRIKLHVMLLLKKKKGHQCNLKTMKVYRN